MSHYAGYKICLGIPPTDVSTAGRLSVSDEILVTHLVNASFVNNILLADSVIVQDGRGVFDEIIQLSDTVIGFNSSGYINNEVVLSDTISAVCLSAYVDENIMLGDTTSAIKQSIRTITDGMSLEDNIIMGVIYPTDITENVNINDTIEAQYIIPGFEWAVQWPDAIVVSGTIGGVPCIVPRQDVINIGDIDLNIDFVNFIFGDNVIHDVGRALVEMGRGFLYSNNIIKNFDNISCLMGIQQTLTGNIVLKDQWDFRLQQSSPLLMKHVFNSNMIIVDARLATPVILHGDNINPVTINNQIEITQLFVGEWVNIPVGLWLIRAILSNEINDDLTYIRGFRC